MRPRPCGPSSPSSTTTSLRRDPRADPRRAAPVGARRVEPRRRRHRRVDPARRDGRRVPRAARRAPLVAKYGYQEPHHFDAGLATSELLELDGWDIATPVRTDDGARYRLVTWPDGREHPLALLRWIDGRPLDADALDGIEVKATVCGRVHAQLLHLAPGARRPHRTDRLRSRDLQPLVNAIANRTLAGPDQGVRHSAGSSTSSNASSRSPTPRSRPSTTSVATTPAPTRGGRRCASMCTPTAPH